MLVYKNCEGTVWVSESTVQLRGGDNSRNRVDDEIQEALQLAAQDRIAG